MSVPLIFDRALVRKRRDRAAATIAGHRFLLDRAMDDVVDRLAFIQRTFDELLVVGAFDGTPARRLRAQLPAARVQELDISSAMLSLCDGPIQIADEEALPVETQSVDCIVAPMTLHLTNDLPGVLWQFQNALRPDGLLLGAMLGGRTLEELAEAMAVAEEEMRGGASPRVAPRVDVRELGGLLQRAGFAMPVADSDIVTVTYATPLDLMRDLKGMGASNALAQRDRTPMTRSLLLRAAEIYANRFSETSGRINATFEIIAFTGWAPHPDQPRPLRPGSATHRLADALGTSELSAGEKPDGS